MSLNGEEITGVMAPHREKSYQSHKSKVSLRSNSPEKSPKCKGGAGNEGAEERTMGEIELLHWPLTRKLNERDSRDNKQVVEGLDGMSTVFFSGSWEKRGC